LDKEIEAEIAKFKTVTMFMLAKNKAFESFSQTLDTKEEKKEVFKGLFGCMSFLTKKSFFAEFSCFD